MRNTPSCGGLLIIVAAIVSLPACGKKDGEKTTTDNRASTTGNTGPGEKQENQLVQWMPDPKLLDQLDEKEVPVILGLTMRKPKKFIRDNEREKDRVTPTVEFYDDNRKSSDDDPLIRFRIEKSDKEFLDRTRNEGPKALEKWLGISGIKPSKVEHGKLGDVPFYRAEWRYSRDGRTVIGVDYHTVYEDADIKIQARFKVPDHKEEELRLLDTSIRTLKRAK